MQEIEDGLDIPVASIVRLEDMIELLEESSEYGEYLDAVLAYRRKYGIGT